MLDEAAAAFRLNCELDELEPAAPELDEDDDGDERKLVVLFKLVKKLRVSFKWFDMKRFWSK